MGGAEVVWKVVWKVVCQVSRVKETRVLGWRECVCVYKCVVVGRVRGCWNRVRL